jgi:hypothetical protein
MFLWLFSLLSFHLVAGPLTFTTIDFPGSTATAAFGIDCTSRFSVASIDFGTP